MDRNTRADGEEDDEELDCKSSFYVQANEHLETNDQTTTVAPTTHENRSITLAPCGATLTE